MSVKVALTSGASAPGSESAPLVLEERDGTAFTIETAHGYVRHIQLDLPDGRSCEDLAFPFEAPVFCEDDSIDIRGPFVLDLVSGTATPSLADLRIPAGTYKRVDVRFDDAEPDDGLVGADERLADHTLHVAGRFEHDGAEMDFDLLLKFNEDARFESPRGVDLGDGGGADALLLLDVSKWFEALPIVDCMEGGDLEVEDSALQIDDQHSGCSDIENALKDAVKRSGQLHGA